MALHSVDREHNSQDIRQDRIAAGTVGNDHIVQRGLGGKKLVSVVDDQDPRITYGFVTGSVGTGINTDSFVATQDFVFGGTQTAIGGPVGTNGSAGSGAQFYFTGSSITVLGSTNPSSGNMRVYIDGVETKGRIPVFVGFRLGGTYTPPIISATDTTIPALAQATAFTATGELYISGERITYTSRDSNGFYGCTRGVNGTTAVAHNANETIYQWDSVVGLYSATNYASKQVLYHNPQLSPGPHKIIIVAETNTTSNQARIYFDGFITGTLLGSDSIFTQVASFVFTGITTDANGHFELGSPTANNNDISRLSLIGYTQSNTESSNTVAMGTVGVKYASDGTATYYLHNGPASATFSITMTFAFIGETL